MNSNSQMLVPKMNLFYRSISVKQQLLGSRQQRDSVYRLFTWKSKLSGFLSDSSQSRKIRAQTEHFLDQQPFLVVQPHKTQA